MDGNKHRMTSIQKRNFIIVLIAGILIFLLFFWPNGQNAADEHMLLIRSQDEPVIYPIVVRMLSTSQDIHEAWGKLIIYGDYHYGYPFYFLSFITLLPVKWLFGEQYTSQTQLNLMLLRQFISVFPMILAVGVMTFLQTRFKSLLQSILLFLFLISIGGIVRNNINWWHPDALAVLAIVFTLFFLDRDHFRVGRNFYLAAAFCGLATAIKLQGVFFAPTILVYLIYARVKNHISTRQTLLAAVGFIIVMTLAAVLTNPFLFYSGPRQRFFDIQAFKTTELSSGYTHDDPTYYQKGPYWWLWTLKKWYGHPLFWVFTIVSLAAGCFFGKNRLINLLIVLWSLPLSIYLLYFVAVKPDHYWLPVILPFFSAVLNIPVILLNMKSPNHIPIVGPPWNRFVAWLLRPRPRQVFCLLVYVVILVEWISYLQQDMNLFISFINKG
jgi:hypothetical protein